jgi:ferredoxin
MRASIDPGRCQGHGRCYVLAPAVFGEDAEGYGTVLGDGTVAAGGQVLARLAALNCPESAITVTVEPHPAQRRTR